MKTKLTYIAVGIIAAFACHAASARQYTVTDLGTEVVPTAINNRGDVTGYLAVPNIGYDHAFLYRDGKMLDLGTFPGGIVSYAYAINNLGEVVGYSDMHWVPALPNGNDPVHAFLNKGCKMKDLGVLGGYASHASDLNDSGEVTGYSSTNFISSQVHAFLYREGKMRDLGTLWGYSSAADWSYGNGINNVGEVVGTSNTPSGAVYAFLYTNGRMQNIGAFQPAAINDHGQVVGYSPFAKNLTQACLYTDGHLLGLGTLPGTVQSQAERINNGGEIVGFCYTANHALTIPFLHMGGQMYDLNKLLVPNSSWTITAIFGINDSGQIVGDGTLNGHGHGILLTVKR